MDQYLSKIVFLWNLNTKLAIYILGNSFFIEDILDYLDDLASWHVAILKGKLAIFQSQMFFQISWLVHMHAWKSINDYKQAILNHYWFLPFPFWNCEIYFKAFWSFKHKKGRKIILKSNFVATIKGRIFWICSAL